MRTEPAWTSYPFQTALSWIAAFVIAALVVLAAECAPTPAHAGWFLEGQAGASYMPSTAPDGLWKQEAFGTSYQGVKLAYGGRIGYRFERPWSVQVGIIHFGTSRTETSAVADQCYNPITHTVTCNVQPMSLKTANTMNGYTLSGTRYFAVTPDWSIPVSVGMALVTARLQTTDAFQPAYQQERYSRMPMWSVGAGLCWRETLCWENTIYTALPGPNYHDPVSTQVLSSTVGIRIPLGG